MEVDGMGKTLSWTYDDEGKLVRYTDMSNAVVLYGYDGLRRKISQTSSARGADGLRQNILYSYDKAGLLSRIEDVTSRQVTTYEYDLAPPGATSSKSPMRFFILIDRKRVYLSGRRN